MNLYINDTSSCFRSSEEKEHAMTMPIETNNSTITKEGSVTWKKILKQRTMKLETRVNNVIFKEPDQRKKLRLY